jgi:hypothetical protein
VTHGLVTIPCEIARGAFSDERIFTIALEGRAEYIGAASWRYCYGPHDTPIRPDEPPPGKSMKGRVAARVVGEQGDGKLLLSLPDGSVVHLGRSQVRPAKEAAPDVPVQP